MPSATEAPTVPARRCMMHAWYGEHDSLRPCPTSLDHACTRWSNSGLQVEDLKVSVTPFVVRPAQDVSVGCSCVPLQCLRDAHLRPLLVRSLGLDTSEGTRHHRHALDGLSCRNRYATVCLGRIGVYSQTCTTYGWTRPTITIIPPPTGQHSRVTNTTHDTESQTSISK